MQCTMYEHVPIPHCTRNLKRDLIILIKGAATLIEEGIVQYLLMVRQYLTLYASGMLLITLTTSCWALLNTHYPSMTEL
jgi:hypothetical protein